jgi:4-hydroxybenzoate polyprenyltransferase
MSSYLKIYRPLNLFFIGLSQILCAYFLDRYASFTSVIENGVFWLILGTVSCASFGYWVNDYYDQKRDIINKKKPSHIKYYSRLIINTHLITFVLVALTSGYLIGIWFLSLFSFTLVLLFLYSWRLKDLPLIGNLIISMLSFYSIYSITMLSSSVDVFLIVHFSLFSGLITFCREIIKDVEDFEGDRAFGSQTLPIRFGKKIINNVVYVLLLLLISLLIFSYYYQIQYFQGALKYIFCSYCVLFIVIPLYKAAIDIRYTNNKSDYNSLSLLMKYVIFTGILSILFF